MEPGNQNRTSESSLDVRTKIVEFVDGPMKGNIASSDSIDDAEIHVAQSIFWLTSQATIGNRIMTKWTPGLEIGRLGGAYHPTWQGDTYEVSERIEGQNELLIRLRYVAAENPPA